MIRGLLLLLLVLLLQGCVNQPDIVGVGNWACFDYYITKTNGERIDGNNCYEPCAMEKTGNVCIKAGQNWLVTDWDNALLGMRAGQKKTVLIMPGKGWSGKYIPAGINRADTLIITINMVSVTNEAP